MDELGVWCEGKGVESCTSKTKDVWTGGVRRVARPPEPQSDQMPDLGARKCDAICPPLVCGLLLARRRAARGLGEQTGHAQRAFLGSWSITSNIANVVQKQDSCQADEISNGGPIDDGYTTHVAEKSEALAFSVDR